LMMMLLGASGGIAALGDTLFPAVTFAEGLKQELDPTSNLLLRLRVAHPAIAVGTGLVMVMVAQAFAAMRQNVATKRLAWLLYGTYGLQLLLGTLNVILLAPVWLQVVHLLLSDVIWFAFVALAAYSFERDEIDLPAPPAAAGGVLCVVSIHCRRPVMQWSGVAARTSAMSGQSGKSGYQYVWWQAVPSPACTLGRW